MKKDISCEWKAIFAVAIILATIWLSLQVRDSIYVEKILDNTIGRIFPEDCVKNK